MIPEAFTYERAGTVAEALDHMSRGAQPLAGGHSLLPALKLRLSAPGALVDIARIPELSGIRVDGGTLVIGACTRHGAVAASSDVAAHAAVLAAAAGGIGDQQVRNRGTIGGSLAHADPHGDLPAVALALGAEIVAEGSSGSAHDPGRRVLRRLLHDGTRRRRADHRDPHPGRAVAGGLRQVQPARPGLGDHRCRGLQGLERLAGGAVRRGRNGRPRTAGSRRRWLRAHRTPKPPGEPTRASIPWQVSTARPSTSATSPA